MKTILNRLSGILFFALLFLSTVSPIAHLRAEDSALLKRAEEVLEKSGSLEKFLENSNACDSYFEIMAEYFGKNKFERKSYNAILDQLKTIIKDAPEISTRLWEATNIGSDFSVKGIIQDDLEGSFSPEKWEVFLKTWKESLQKEASQVLSHENPTEYAKRESSEIEQKIIRFEENNSKLPRKARTQEKAAFYKDLKESESIKQLSAYYALEELNQPPFTIEKDLLDPKELAKTLIALLDGKSLENSQTPQKLKPFLRSLVPGINELVGPSQAFQIDLEKSESAKKVNPLRYWLDKSFQEWTFRAIPRRFHGIFKGVMAGECIGGGCNYLHSLMPERWLTIALKESKLWFVEGKNGYDGFVHVVPVSKEGITYGSLDLMSAALNKTILIESENSESYTCSVFDQAYIKLYEQKPESWKGFAVGNTRAIDNNRNQTTLMASEAYAEGSDLGDSQELYNLDYIDRKIIGKIKLTGANVDMYTNSQMVFDTSVKGADRATLLAPPSEITEALFLDEKWVSSKFQNLESEARIFASFANLNPSNPQVLKQLEVEGLLIREALENSNHKYHKAALELLDYARSDTVFGILKYSATNPKNSKEFVFLIRYLSIFNKSERSKVKAGLNLFLDKKFSELDIQTFLRNGYGIIPEWPNALFLPQKIHKLIFKEWLRSVEWKCKQNPKCYFEDFKNLFETNNDFKKEINFSNFFLEDFYKEFIKPMRSTDFDLKFSKKVFNFLVKYCNSVDPLISLTKESMLWSQSAKDYIEVAVFSVEPPSEYYKNAMDSLIESTFKDHFMVHNPTIEQINAIKSKTKLVSTTVKIIEAAYPQVQSAEDFISLISSTEKVPNPTDEFKKALSDFANSHVDDFLSFKPSIDEIKEFQNNYIITYRSLEKLIPAALLLVKTPKDYIEIAKMEKWENTPELKTLRDLAFKKTWSSTFVTKKTSADDVIDFIKWTTDPDMDREVIKAFVFQTDSIAEITTVFSETLLLYNDEKNLMKFDDLAVECFEKFLSLKPSIKEINAFRASATKYVHAYIQVSQMALDKAKSPKEFIELAKITNSKSAALLQARIKLIEKNLSIFLKLDPTYEQILHLMEIVPELKIHIKNLLSKECMSLLER